MRSRVRVWCTLTLCRVLATHTLPVSQPAALLPGHAAPLKITRKLGRTQLFPLAPNVVHVPPLLPVQCGAILSVEHMCLLMFFGVPPVYCPGRCSFLEAGSLCSRVEPTSRPSQLPTAEQHGGLMLSFGLHNAFWATIKARIR